MVTSALLTWDDFIQVTPHQDPDSRYQYLPHQKECTVTLPPPAPSAINASSIVVIHFTVSLRKVELRMKWSPPAKTFGNITNYQVRILDQPASFKDIVSQSTQVAITSPKMVGTIQCDEYPIRALLW